MDSSFPYRSRVSYRKHQWTEKGRGRRELELALEKERKRREALLESTKEPVEIDYDPANVVMDTHVSF